MDGWDKTVWRCSSHICSCWKQSRFRRKVFFNFFELKSNICSRAVSVEEGEAFAKENDMIFLETSAKSGQNIIDVRIIFIYIKVNSLGFC